MHEAQASKVGILLPPQLKDDGDFAGNTYIDTAGFEGGLLRVLFLVGTLDAAIGSTAETAAPKLEECDTTDGTYTDITGAALADAIADDEDDSIFCIDLDLTKTHKRYIEVDTPHAGNGTTGANLCITGQLFSPSGKAPSTATEMGFAEHIKV